MVTLRIGIFVLFYGGLSCLSMYAVWEMCYPGVQIRSDLRFSPSVSALVAGIIQEERTRRIEECMYRPPVDVFLSVNESAFVERKQELLQR